MTIQHAQDILQSTFGYEQFRDQQKTIIETLLNGGDALVLMPTGGGKSLCYQIPSLVRDGVGIIVSPLIALMQDQVDALTQLGIKAAFLNSSMSHAENQLVEQQLLNNELDCLYLAPERLLTPYTLNMLNRCQVALFAIDEAHCVSQWGHDFRVEYQQLSLLAQHFPNVPRIALTATADERTRLEIVEQLQLQQAKQFISSFDRPNIRYEINESINAKTQLLQFINNQHANDAGIIYCLSRKKVEDIAYWLCEQGKEALAYHAGMPAEQKRQNQQRFLREEGIIIVATIAFGMGIDKPDVRFVAHLNLPKSMEAYYQETGRAGRDGQPANAWMCFGLNDVITLRQFTEDSNANEQQKRIQRHKLDAMLGFCELTQCRRQTLLDYFGETLKEPCGNCDNCQIPPETWDATVDAQKALSCVFRTGQRFGVSYLTDVLRGKEDERITRFGHDKVSTFGIGAEQSQKQWRSIYRQLIAHGFLSVDLEQYGALKLTQKSKPLLKGEQQLELRKVSVSKAKQKKEKFKSSLSPVDEPLWDALKALRLSLAQEQGVPPFVIFHDSTLASMVSLRPDSLDAFATISGVGESKLYKYGDDFVALLQEYPKDPLFDNNLSATVHQTLMCFKDGLDAEATAKKRDLTIGSVHTHYSQAIELGVIEISDCLSLEQHEIDEITAAIELHNVMEDGKIKPVFEELEEQYDYGIIKCVLASL